MSNRLCVNGNAPHHAGYNIIGHKQPDSRFATAEELYAESHASRLLSGVYKKKRVRAQRRCMTSLSSAYWKPCWYKVQVQTSCALLREARNTQLPGVPSERSTRHQLTTFLPGNSLKSVSLDPLPIHLSCTPDTYRRMQNLYKKIVSRLVHSLHYLVVCGSRPITTRLLDYYRRVSLSSSTFDGSPRTIANQSKDNRVCRIDGLSHSFI